MRIDVFRTSSAAWGSDNRNRFWGESGVPNAYTFTMHAPALAGRADDIRRVIREYVAQGTLTDFMTNTLGPDLDPS